MRAIEKKSISKLDPTTGSIVDTWNVEDKINNAPSIRLVKEQMDELVSDSIDKKILHGTTEPSNTLGKDGDIYIMIFE